MDPRFMFRVLAACLALLAASPTAADEEPGWYAVELIVFLHRADAARTDERWPADPGSPDLDEAASLHPPTRPAVLTPYEQLPPDALRLGGTFDTLERSSRYRAILHTGWMQAGLPRDAATPVRIDEFSGDRLDTIPLEIELPPDPVEEDTLPEFLEFEPDTFDLTTPETTGDDGMGVPDWRESGDEPGQAPPRMIAGTITLSRQRFLHVDADLVYTSDDPLPEPADDADTPFWRYRLDRNIEWLAVGASPGPATQAYRLRDSRQVGTGELHYFDHPKFGVIVAIHPVPEEEVEARRDAYEAAYRAALLRREAERLDRP